VSGPKRTTADPEDRRPTAQSETVDQPVAEAAPDSELAQQWARVRGRLRAEFGEAAFRSWLKPLVLLGQRGGEVRIGVPSRFMRDWVIAHYADRLRVLWAGENPSVRAVELVVVGQRPQATRATSPATGPGRPAIVPAPEPAAPAPPPVAAAADPAPNGHEEFSAPLDPRFTFENFVAGKPNELAYAAAHRVAEAGGGVVQPAFPLWRRRARQDPPDARHRLAYPPAHAGSAG
jgi:chromosomal replication initiator protein